MMYKFTEAYTNKAIYIDMDKIISIREVSYNPNLNYGLSSSGTSIPTNPQDEGKTCLMGIGGLYINVHEHITEVLAIIEGRDPKPAKVLFGKTS